MYKWGVIAGGGLVAIGILYTYSYNPESYVQADEISSHTEVADRTVERVIDTRKPDGTQVIETITQKDIAKVESKHAERATTEPVTAPKSQYRIGLDYLPSLDRAPSASDVAVRAGARLGNSPVWVEVEIDLKHKQGSVGVSAEF